MRVAVVVFGILVVLEGVLLLVKPEVYSKAVAILSKGKLVYIAALLKIVVGVFMLVAAMSCNRQMIMIVLGLLAGGTGVTMLGISQIKLKKIFEWWSVRPKFVIRVLGILAMAVGGLIIYAAGMPQ